jgi:hypothetical protein
MYYNCVTFFYIAKPVPQLFNPGGMKAATMLLQMIVLSVHVRSTHNNRQRSYAQLIRTIKRQSPKKLY